MLEVDDLTVGYGPIAAVTDVSLNVEEGEIVALLGPNGAGKSTTLSTIVGLLTPTRGSVRFEGEPLTGRRPERIAALGIALVPEGRRIFGTLTVAENLQLGATGRSRRERERSLGAVLERFGQLVALLGTPADRLSGGEQQQLAIARALMGRPRLLLLDEPSLGLAPQIVDLVFDTIEALRSDGVTVLLVEQHAARAIACADRTCIMSNGRVVFAGTGAELGEQVDLWDTYFGTAEADAS